MHGVSHSALPSGGGGAARQFDSVLVDAPCSGTGVLCKRADLRWQRGAADLDGLLALQRQLLAAAVPCVRPGGALVYSTCSLEAEENEEQVAWLLRQFPGLLEVEWLSDQAFERMSECTDAAKLPAEWGVSQGGAGSRGVGHVGLITEEGFLRCLPHVHGSDGAFAARLRVRKAPAE